MNLSLNGIDAMSGKGWQPSKLIISSRNNGDGKIIAAVTDTGTGLDPRNHKSIFNAYFTTKPGGLGFGLAISRTIIERHDGRLWATPNDGQERLFNYLYQRAAKINKAAYHHVPVTLSKNFCRDIPK